MWLKNSVYFQQYGGLYNPASYQPWAQNSGSPSFLPSSFSSFPSSPPTSSSAHSFSSPFTTSQSFLSSSPYLTSAKGTSGAFDFAPQIHHPKIGGIRKNADTDQKLSTRLSELKLKIHKSKSDQKPEKSESENQLSDSKDFSKQKHSLYDALRSRADMVKSENSKSAALLKSLSSPSPEQLPTDETEEKKLASSLVKGFPNNGNSLEDFPVRFHPEEELARKGWKFQFSNLLKFVAVTDAEQLRRNTKLHCNWRKCKICNAKYRRCGKFQAFYIVLCQHC